MLMCSCVRVRMCVFVCAEPAHRVQQADVHGGARAEAPAADRRRREGALALSARPGAHPLQLPLSLSLSPEAPDTTFAFALANVLVLYMSTPTPSQVIVGVYCVWSVAVAGAYAGPRAGRLQLLGQV